MRSVVVAAALFAGLVVLTPSRVAAQDPETPPPPPPPAQPRGEVRSPSRVEGPRGREEQPAPVNRAPERAADRAVERPVRVAEPPVATAPPAAPSESSDQGARPRGSVRRPQADDRVDHGRPIDRAIPRSQAPPPPRTTVVRHYPYRYYPNYSHYYDPWGYGLFGIGYFYYSPWSWGPYGAYGYPPYGGAVGYDIGRVRIKVKPRDAEVWVDGYYAGTVDDFDGMFQALRLDSGGYRIEIRKPGFETLTFDVRVQFDRTTTFRGEMRPIP
jgi:hypothetical protein